MILMVNRPDVQAATAWYLQPRPRCHSGTGGVVV